MPPVNTHCIQLVGSKRPGIEIGFIIRAVVFHFPGNLAKLENLGHPNKTSIPNQIKSFKYNN